MKEHNREQFIEHEGSVPNRQNTSENDNTTSSEVHTTPSFRTHNDSAVAAASNASTSLLTAPLETAVASLIATLYGSANLPRNIVQIIIENLQHIIMHSVVPLMSLSMQNMVDLENSITNSSLFHVIHTLQLLPQASTNFQPNIVDFVSLSAPRLIFHLKQL